MARRLRDLQEQVERARQQREAGQAARERAREIAESMTPSEREQMERWAKQFGEDDRGTGAEPGGRAPVAPPADDGSSPPAPAYTTEDVELADADPGDRIIAEWLDDLRGAPDAPGTTRGTDSVRETRRRAEQAIERSNVHPRYRDLVRRYFDRFGDTARKAAEQPATPPSTPTPTPAPAPASSPTPAPAPPAPAGGGGT